MANPSPEVTNFGEISVNTLNSNQIRAGKDMGLTLANSGDLILQANNQGNNNEVVYGQLHYDDTTPTFNFSTNTQIKSIANPTDSQDVVTRSFMESAIDNDLDHTVTDTNLDQSIDVVTLKHLISVGTPQAGIGTGVKYISALTDAASHDIGETIFQTVEDVTPAIPGDTTNTKLNTEFIVKNWASGSEQTALKVTKDKIVDIQSGGGVFLPDSVELKMGNTVAVPDATITHSGSELSIINNTGTTGHMTFWNKADSGANRSINLRLGDDVGNSVLHVLNNSGDGLFSVNSTGLSRCIKESASTNTINIPLQIYNRLSPGTAKAGIGTELTFKTDLTDITDHEVGSLTFETVVDDTPALPDNTTNGQLNTQFIVNNYKAGSEQRVLKIDNNGEFEIGNNISNVTLKAQSGDLILSSAIGKRCRVINSDANLQIDGPQLYKTQTASSISDSNNQTYTAAEMLSGLIERNCSGLSRTDTIATGKQTGGNGAGIVANIPNAVVGTTFELTISNISAAGQDITLQEVATYALIKGVTTIKAGESMSIQGRVTDITINAEKYELYTLGSLSGEFDDNIHIVTDTVDNAVSTAVTLKHTLSGGTHDIGIGTGMNFVTETTAGDEIGMSLTSVTTNVGSSSEAFDFVVNLMSGGATADEALRVTSSKVLTIPTTGNIFLPDNSEIQFGDTTTPDVTVKFNTSDLLTTMVEGNNVIKLENSNTGFIVKDTNDKILAQTLGSGSTLFRKTTTSFSAVENILKLQSRLDTPASATVGYGVSMTFDVDDTAGNIIETTLFKSVATDTTDGAENYDYYIQTMSGGSLADILKIDSAGTINIGKTSGNSTLKARSGNLILDTASGKNCTISDSDGSIQVNSGDFVLNATNSGTLRLIDNDGSIQIDGPQLYKKQTAASIPTAGPATYTAANILTGLIIRNCNGASRTDTLIGGNGLTGLIQNMPNAVVGTTFNLSIANVSTVGQDITLQEVVSFAEIEGITTIKAGESINAQIIVTDITSNAEKYTMYTFGTSGGDVDDNIHIVTDTVDNAVSTAVTLKHTLSGGTHDIGIGTGMDFVTETTAGEEIGMSLTAVTTNVGAGTEAFDFIVNLMSGGTAADEALRVTSSKVLTIPTTGNIFLPDNSEIQFGDTTTPDVTVKFNTSDLLTTMVEGNNVIKLENSNTGFIVKDPSDNIVAQTLGSGSTLFRKTTTSFSAVENIIRLQSFLDTPGSATVGYGVSMAFDTKDTLGNTVANTLFKSVATDTTDGAENYDYYIQTCSSGSLADVLKIDSTGIVNIGKTSGNSTLKSRSGNLILDTASGKSCTISDSDGSIQVNSGDFVLNATNSGTLRLIDNDGSIQIDGTQLYKDVNLTLVSGSGTGYTVSQILSGLISRPTGGVNRTDTFLKGNQTAGDGTGLVANIPNAVVGTSFDLIIVNDSVAGNLTLAGIAGSAIIKGVTTINSGESMKIQMVVTSTTLNSETYEIYTLSSSGDVDDNIHIITDTVDNAVSTAVTLKHTLSSGTHAPGIGTGMDFVTETTAGEEIGMSLTSVTTNVGSTTEDFDFVLNLMKDGNTANEALRVTSDKVLTIPSDGDIFLPNSVELKMGNTAADPNALIRHSGSEFSIYNEEGATGHLFIHNKANSGSNKNIILKLSTDDGSSAIEVKNTGGNNVFKVASDGNSTHIQRGTNVSAVSVPLVLYNKLSAGTAESGIGTELTFRSDLTDASGGHNIGSLAFRTVEDDSPAQPNDTTNNKLNTKVVIKNWSAGASQTALEINEDKIVKIQPGGNLHLPDNAEIQFGDTTTPDVTVKFNATDLLTTMVEGNNVIKLENSNTGFIVKDSNSKILAQTLGSGSTLFRKTTTSSSSVENIVRLQSFLDTPGSATVGYGVSMAFDTKDTLGNTVANTLFKSVATDTTDGAENYDYYIQTCSSGSLADVLKIDSTGIINIGKTSGSSTLKARSGDLILSSASSKKLTIFDTDGNIQIDGPQLYKTQAVSSISDSNNQTYTVAEMLSGLILRDCTGASRIDVLAPGSGASGLVQSITNAIVGTTFELLIVNQSDIGEDLSINNNSTSAIVKGNKIIKAGSNMKYTGIVIDITNNAEIYHLISHGYTGPPSIPIGAGTGVDPFIFTIEQNTNYSWTPADLCRGYVRRVSTSNRIDVLPNASTFLTAYPTLVVGDIINLEILKTGTGRVRMDTSPDGTFVGFSGGGTFTSLTTRNQQVNNNWTMKFSIIIYETGATPKIDILRMTRN